VLPPALPEEDAALIPGLYLKATEAGAKRRLTLWGPGVDAGFRARLIDWIQQQRE
jgi:hypothetical protein